MRVVTLVLVAVGGLLAVVGALQMSGLALFAALAASVATALRNPRHWTSWIPSAVIVIAIGTVILADLIGVGTHHQGA
jgi:hypothetical protein